MQVPPSTVHAGGCAVWALPPDGTCARMARALVREMLCGLRLPDVLVHDAVTMVSELATNALTHAGDAPELYLYRRGRWPEIVVKVFDTGPWKGALAALRPEPSCESGRGLEVVAGLSGEHGGTWGVHRTRSWLRPASGKATFFTVRVPHGSAGWGLPRRDCRTAIRELAEVLRARGVGPLHCSEGWGIATLSVRAGMTAWIREETLSVSLPPRGTVRFPTWDLAEAAEAIVRCGEDLDAR
ncbi:ATP-binding protein [Actinomadura barringtoniae]|uniref:ATP-binding protein n=1 Tax=Actinomadura barringtoniae TaxID=1427535 RepID=A0A939TD01_9ACTN|nr:ATP-binding protein [Actinomadura barringtoniae]MBO2451795.1 ATP-binding protein [Actinomadura barringtoniae]